MTAKYHPDRLSMRPWPTTEDVDVSSRLTLMADVWQRWVNAQGEIYDLDDVSDSLADIAELTIADLGIRDEAFYAHRGGSKAITLGPPGGAFVEGVYFIRQSYNDRDGYFVAIVTSSGPVEESDAAGVARIACGWVDVEMTVEEGLIHLGLWGDPEIVDSPSRFDIECFVGEALTKVARMTIKNSPGLAPSLN